MSENTNVEHPFVRDREYRTVYANNVKFGSSPVEIRLTFCAYLDDVGQGKFVTQEQVCVVVAPSALKPMLQFIEQMVSQHEKKYGPIPEIPKDASQEQH